MALTFGAILILTLTSGGFSQYTPPPYMSGYDPYSNSSSSGSSGGGGANSGAMEASQDGISMAAAAILANSANLTALNEECNKRIYANLMANIALKDTQPQVPINIFVNVIIISLNDISDKTGVVSMTTRIDFRWYDERLNFTTPSDSCHHESLLTKTKGTIWFPYFLIQNGASVIFYPDAFEKYPSILGADGFIEWRVAFNLNLACSMDVKIFPFDRQVCMLVLQSPHYGPGELNYTLPNKEKSVVLLSDDVDHPTWGIVGQGVQFTFKVPGVRFWLQFKRKYEYYIFTLMIPLLAVFLQTLCTFIIPANAEEKLSTAVAGLLSYFFIFLLFVQTTPQVSSAQMPVLLVFFVVQTVLSLIVVLLCAIMSRMVLLEAEEEEEENERRLKEKRANQLSLEMKQNKQALVLQGVRMPRIYSSIFNRSAKPRVLSGKLGSPASATGNMFAMKSLKKPPASASSSNSIAISMLDQAAGHIKKNRIHSEAFNDICFLFYLAFVLSSTCVLGIFFYVSYKDAALAFNTTPIQTCVLNEKGDIMY